MIDIYNGVTEVISKHLGFDEEEANAIDYLNSLRCLNCDSLDVVEIISLLEIKFGIDISEDECDKYFKMESTIQDIVNFIDSKANKSPLD